MSDTASIQPKRGQDGVPLCSSTCDMFAGEVAGGCYGECLALNEKRVLADVTGSAHVCIPQVRRDQVEVEAWRKSADAIQDEVRSTGSLLPRGSIETIETIDELRARVAHATKCECDGKL